MLSNIFDVLLIITVIYFVIYVVVDVFENLINKYVIDIIKSLNMFDYIIGVVMIVINISIIIMIKYGDIL